MGAACVVNREVIGNSEAVKMRGVFTNAPRIFHFGTTCPEVVGDEHEMLLIYWEFIDF